MSSQLKSSSAQVLLLGITPELQDLAQKLTAIDINAEMLRSLWNRRCCAVQGDWLHLPFPEMCFELVVGDGSLSNLSYPDSYAILFNELKRVLIHGGRIAMRLFTSPQEAEDIDAVVEQASTGSIRSFHAFKWRLAMALVTVNQTPNIPVSLILSVFERFFPDRSKLAHASGWKLDEIATIDAYRNSQAEYSFPSLAHVRQLVPQGLTEKAVLTGSYELAERCPILVLESGA